MDNSAYRGDRAQLVDSDDGLIHSPDDPGVQQDSREMSQLHMDSHSGLPCSRSSSKTQNEGLKTIVIGCICFAVCVTVALIMTIYLGNPVLTPHGGVVADSAKCSELGMTVLTKGGSAADAGITAALCVGVLEPLHSGIGGGGFAVIRLNKNNITEVFDFMSSVPDGAFVPIKEGSLGLLVAVPGFLRGLKKIHERYGRLKWKDVVLPVVNLISQPVNMSNELLNEIDKLPQGSELRNYFKNITILPQSVGGQKTMNLTAMQSLLQSVAERGDTAVYEEGVIAKEILDKVNGAGGKLTVDDLMRYSVVRQPPIKALFYGNNIETVGAPGGGPSLLLMLNLLQNLTSFDVAWNSTDIPHILIEAAKYSMPHLSILGDPQVNISINEIVKLIISQSYADQISGRIRIDLNRTYDATHYAVSLPPPLSATSQSGALWRGTSHVSAIGPEDDMISITTTLNGPFGSGLVTRSGIILNNHMISFNQSQARKLTKGERPVTTLSPAIIYNPTKSCAKRYSLGATHGFAAIEGLVQVIADLIGQRKNLTEALDSARIYTLPTGCILYEVGVSQDVRRILEQKGHRECTTDIITDSAQNAVHCLVKVNQTVFGKSDWRAVGSGSAYY